MPIGSDGDICDTCVGAGILRCTCCQSITRHTRRVFGVLKNPKHFHAKGFCLSCNSESFRFNPDSGLCNNCTTGKMQMGEVCTSCAPRIQLVCIKCKEDVEIQDEKLQCLNCRLSSNWIPTAETRVRKAKCNTCGIAAILGHTGICVRCHVKNELFKQGMGSEIFECTRCGQHTRNDDMCDTCLRQRRTCSKEGCKAQYVPYHFDDRFCDKHKPKCSGCRQRTLVDGRNGLCDHCAQQQVNETCTYCGQSTLDQFSDKQGHCFDCSICFTKYKKEHE